MSVAVVGNLDVGRSAAQAPTLDVFGTEPLDLGSVEVFHAAYEMSRPTALDLLPPALWPTNPPFVSWLFTQGEEGPGGRFRLAQIGIGCVAALKRRVYLLSCVTDSPALADTLRTGWGLDVTVDDVEMRQYVDKVAVRLRAGGETTLDLQLQDPTPLPAVVDFTLFPTLHLVNTPLGPRLLEIAPSRTPTEPVLRGPARIDQFADPHGLRPMLPIVAGFQRMDVVVPALTLAIDPDVPQADATTPLPPA